MSNIEILLFFLSIVGALSVAKILFNKLIRLLLPKKQNPLSRYMSKEELRQYLEQYLTLQKSSSTTVQRLLRRNSLHFLYIDMRVDSDKHDPAVPTEKMKSYDYDGYIVTNTKMVNLPKWPPRNWFFLHSNQIIFYFQEGLLQNILIEPQLTGP